LRSTPLTAPYFKTVNPQQGGHILAKDKEKMFRSESMNEKWHVSKEGHASIEHYVKVIPAITLQN
jgi:hypothetical protein